MRILFLCHSFNSLTQRLHVALTDAGHEVSVEFDINDETTIDAVARFAPELVVAPFLKRAIPEAVWRAVTCLVVHPGIVGDRGPSALDRAILDGEREWGVTVLEANGEFDAGDVWASRTFPMRAASKASLYRTEVSSAAVAAVLEAVGKAETGGFEPTPLAEIAHRGQWRPLLRQAERRIDWPRDDTETVVRKVRSADGFPGLECELLGRRVRLFDARPADGHSGAPGRVFARSGPALLIGTRDGAVWIGHAKDTAGPHPFKLPATTVFAADIGDLPEIPVDDARGYREIRVECDGDIACVNFEFYNGAMDAGQCERLLDAFNAARERGPRVVVLAGGHDFWSNGMHLNVIEASESPADASWRNINAIDDLAAAIIGATDCLTVAALSGNAGAGGVFLARAADFVWTHDETVLNPHYKDMGNLYGSEYWTYLLPRTCGDAQAERITQSRLPMGVPEARALGLVDRSIARCRRSFGAELEFAARELAACPEHAARIEAKRRRREADEVARPLADYRRDELARMHDNFYGFDPSYHVARYNFVYKVPRSRTPLTIATHRRTAPATGLRQAS